MSTASSSKPHSAPLKPEKGPIELRQITAFPRIKDFYNLLFDRFFMVLEQFFLEKPFSSFINALPRDHEAGTIIQVERYGSLELCYAGVARQQELLKYLHKNKALDNLAESWKYLDDIRIQNRGRAEEAAKAPKQPVAQVTSQLYDDIREGKSELQNIEIFRLKTYFSNEEAMKLEVTQHEYKILSAFFDIDHYNVLSIPLIQFGEIDGVIHIIYHEQENEVFFKKDAAGAWHANKKVIGRVIKAMSREYEGLMLDWEIEGANFDFKQNAYNRVVDPHFDKNLFDRLEENSILKELGYQEYYLRHKPYFDARFEMETTIPAQLIEQYRINAILSIIIDSYAHNITAHSLTGLEWWFRQRMMKYYNDKDPERLPQDSDQADSALVHEMHHLIKYLQDKGPFWTALIRERSFGGEVMSLYNVLWEEFARNSLLLGTIAYSEGVLKVKIKVSFLENISYDNDHNIFFKKKIAASGTWCTVDVQQLYEHAILQKDDLILDRFTYKGDPEKHQDDPDEHQNLSDRLKAVKVFFPGSVIGRQALCTIIENELRNVKHYSKEVQETMRKQGLTLHISIEDQALDPLNKHHTSEYYKIGIWLEHPILLSKKTIIDRLDKINKDIVDPASNSARLGGTYQDKVCAAYLFNNNFVSVEQRKTDRDKRFYPWVKLGSSPVLQKDKTQLDEVCISARRCFDDTYAASRAAFEANYKPHPGHYKKFIHLWKGADVYTITNPDNIFANDENHARFRFVNINDAPSTTKRRLREEGSIRIIRKETNSLVEAYRVWLLEWLGRDHYRINFQINGSPLGALVFDPQGIQYYNTQAKAPLAIGFVQEVNLVHAKEDGSNQNQLVRYRNHGLFIEYFCGRPADIRTMEIPESKAAELLEVLATRILIFDNRIATRLENINLDVLNKQLACYAFTEDVDLWEEQKQLGFHHYHILVLHLSFVEAFRTKENDKKYSEENITEFIEQEILSNPKIGDNFLLIITSGRGRTQWLENLKKEQNKDYAMFINFRPIESILASIEGGLSIKDDLEMKSRLIGSLLGS